MKRRDIAAATAPAREDWLLLMLTVMIAGSSFAMIRASVETMPPLVIGVIRLWVGAGLLYGLMRLKGRRFPRPLVKTSRGPRLHAVWATMLTVGIVGNTIPFFLFPWAQQYVPSGLAGVYMAFMPLFTLGLAFLFANEALTPAKLAGFGLGFIGILILMGPSAMAGSETRYFLAEGALLLAAFLYAAAAVLSRRAPPVRPRVFSAGLVLCAAITATPALLLTELDPGAWSLSSLLAVIGLGLGPSGLGVFLIIVLIKRAGPGFMALTNYMTPVYAVLLGALLFGERLQPNVFIALSVILLGVFVSQRRPPAAPIAQTSISPR